MRAALQEHFVDVWKGDQYEAEFAKINPNSKIPAIVDHDGPGGKALHRVRVRRDPALSRRQDRQSSCPMTWPRSTSDAVLMVQLTASARVRAMDHFKLFAPKTGSDYSVARYTSKLKRLYSVLEKRLGEAPYLGGQDYTVADIATFPWTRNHDAQGVKWDDHPNLARWYNAIDARSGGEGRARQGGPLSSSRTARPPPTTTRTASSIAASTPWRSRPRVRLVRRVVSNGRNRGGGVGPPGQGRRRHGRELGRRRRRGMR